MSELQEAVAALRREVEAILADPDPSRPTVSLRSIRVTIGLECHGTGGDRTWRPGTKPGPHSMTLEWSPAGSTATAAIPVMGPAPISPSTAWTEADAHAVGTTLDDVFGPPGFDAAARAGVFRELAAEAGERRMHEVLNAIQTGATALADDTAQRARHGIARLLDRGPSGARTAAGILAQILSRHPLDRVLGLIDERWRFGSG